MRKLLSTLFVALVVGACTHPIYGYPAYEDVPPANCKSSTSAVYDISEFTDPIEQEQLVKAVGAWGDLSKEQIDFTVTLDPTTPGARKIHRVHSTDKVVMDYEATQSDSLGPNGHVAGWHEPDETIYLVVDRVAPAELQALAEHELGHGAHLRWPYCMFDNEHCIHSPDPEATMAYYFSGNATLTPSDLALCRASCLCP